ncbi:hypothetical protein CB1_000552002 [Camelus ferus]|nr:hypothetical protein CB1_000552002 [Camelus ferus]
MEDVSFPKTHHYSAFQVFLCPMAITQWSYVQQYVYLRQRQELDFEGQKVHVILAQSTSVPQFPEKSGVIRVKQYKQRLAIQSDGKRGSKVPSLLTRIVQVKPEHPRGPEVWEVTSDRFRTYTRGAWVGRRAGRTVSEDAAPAQQNPRDSGPACLELQPQESSCVGPCCHLLEPGWNSLGPAAVATSEFSSDEC